MAYTSMAGALAEHVPGEIVAVKPMDSRLDDPDAVERFRREPDVDTLWYARLAGPT